MLNIILARRFKTYECFICIFCLLIGCAAVSLYGSELQQQQLDSVVLRDSRRIGVADSLNQIASSDSTKEIGSLVWTLRTGGTLTRSEKRKFVFTGVRFLAAATVKRVFLKHKEKTDLSQFNPPNTPIVNEAIQLLRQHSPPEMVNHCFRTAYWTLVIMKQQKAELSPTEIEEAWVAALLHDIGLDVPASFGEFTLGGVAFVSKLAAKYNWDKRSERKACEAITLNPNGHIRKGKYGLLAWAMNIGGFAETSLSPYRFLMHRENIKELETMYPRTGLYKNMPAIMDKEFARFPNQRYAVLKKLGVIRRRLRDSK